MQARDVVGYVFLPLVLLIASLFAEGRLFESPWAITSFPWFMRLLAYSLLIVGGTALLCQCAPGQIPRLTFLVVWGASAVLITAKLLWDVYAPKSRFEDTEVIWLVVPDLLGFIFVLLGVFLVPRSILAKAKA